MYGEGRGGGGTDAQMWNRKWVCRLYFAYSECDRKKSERHGEKGLP